MIFVDVFPDYVFYNSIKDCILTYSVASPIKHHVFIYVVGNRVGITR